MKRLLLALGLILTLAASAGAGPVPDCCSPRYDAKVMQSYRQLMFKMSVYAAVPRPGQGVRLGIYQAQGAYGQGAVAKNLARLEEAVWHAAQRGVQLLSFPELYVNGYTMSRPEAHQEAQTVGGPIVTQCRAIAKKYNMALLVPYAEKATGPGGKTQYFDSVAVIGADGGLVVSYRKTHLWGRDERANWSFGQKLCPVFRVNGFPVSVLNCYECEFLELTRALALRGAKLVVGPTAADCYATQPDGKRSAIPYPDISRLLIPAYAYANNIFFAYSNHCGYESLEGVEWHYRGNSIICGPHGDVIVAAGHQQDTMLIADVVPAYYGASHPESDYLKDRRPELYKELVAPKVGFVPGGWVYPAYGSGREVMPKGEAMPAGERPVAK